jgi:hypothetical protein
MVKGKFGLIAFWPIHFSIFPFMCMINFTVFGIGEGLFGYYMFDTLLHNSCKKIIVE